MIFTHIIVSIFYANHIITYKTMSVKFEFHDSPSPNLNPKFNGGKNYEVQEDFNWNFTVFALTLALSRDKNVLIRIQFCGSKNKFFKPGRDS